MLPLCVTPLSYLRQYATALCNRLWKWRRLFARPLMETEGDRLGNRLWKRKATVWATAYGNGRRPFGQPLMETEGGRLGNRFIQPKQVTQHSMQPL
jgi:hypothetical protein